jgi:hypothetical protein
MNCCGGSCRGRRRCGDGFAVPVFNLQLQTESLLHWGEQSMTVLNTFLAVSGWVWTVLVVCFAAGYALGYKAGAHQKAATNP